MVKMSTMHTAHRNLVGSAVMDATGPVEPPVSYPGLLHFRCGHGISVSGDTVGPSVWMVATDTERTQLGVSMQPENAVTVAAALTDSALRATEMDGRLKAVGGAVETTLRQVLDRIGVAKAMLPPELNAGDETPGFGLDLVAGQIRWLLGDRV